MQGKQIESMAKEASLQSVRSGLRATKSIIGVKSSSLAPATRASAAESEGVNTKNRGKHNESTHRQS